VTVNKAEQRESARQVLFRTGLTETLDKWPHELSGATRQRVSVARALAIREKVLLMDEPFAALDVQTRVNMQSFLLDVWRESGASVIFVTHHIDEAMAWPAGSSCALLVRDESRKSSRSTRRGHATRPRRKR
jgi:NitT/TauT family transport system ATP-binding protein